MAGIPPVRTVHFGSYTGFINDVCGYLTTEAEAKQKAEAFKAATPGVKAGYAQLPNKNWVAFAEDGKGQDQHEKQGYTRAQSRRLTIIDV